MQWFISSLITHKEILKNKSKFLVIICRKRRIFGFGTPLDVFFWKRKWYF
jgi:hypothetical protein